LRARQRFTFNTTEILMSKTPEGTPVPLMTITAFKHDGKHYAVGDVLQDVEPELAKELAGAGRVRLASAEEAAGKKAAKKAEA
jgi:hypothetical protein